MKNSLLFDFNVDKSTNMVFVKREFEADQSLVWNAFTRQEILDQWWAPKPWTSKTKYMNFEIGGRRFYAMCSPQGEEHWCIQDYTAISPIRYFKFIDAFADKDENINTEFPSADWHLEFSEQLGVTTVNISIKHKTLAAMQQHIEMGFQTGFRMTLNYLEQLIGILKGK